MKKFITRHPVWFAIGISLIDLVLGLWRDAGFVTTIQKTYAFAIPLAGALFFLVWFGTVPMNFSAQREALSGVMQSFPQ